MKLVGFGDSFVEGQIKKPFENSKEERAEINFLNQLYKLSDRFIKYDNRGVRGCNNKYIAHRVYQYLRDHVGDLSNHFILISWTEPQRGNFYNEIKDKYPTGPNVFHQRARQEFESNILMLGVAKMLEERNVKYCYTNSFSNHFYENSKAYTEIPASWINATSPKHSLYDIITERYLSDETDFIPFTQNDVSEYVAECYHPTALGHRLIAKTLNNEIEKLFSTIYKD